MDDDEDPMDESVGKHKDPGNFAGGLYLLSSINGPRRNHFPSISNLLKMQ